MKDRPPIEHFPIEPKNSEVTDLLYGDYDNWTLRNKGFDPKVVSSWSISLFRGSVPVGFSNLDDFENHVLSRLHNIE